MNTGKAIFYGLALIALSALSGCANVAEIKTERETGGVSYAQVSQKGLSTSVLNAVAAQVTRCWYPPARTKDTGKSTASIRVKMNPDATVKSSMIISDIGSDTSYRSAVESALRASLNSRCRPWPLPLDQYAKWKTLTLTFNLNDGTILINNLTPSNVFKEGKNAYEEAKFCKRWKAASIKMNQEAPFPVDAVTTSVGMAVICVGKTVEFKKVTTISLADIPKDKLQIFREYEQKTWNKMYCAGEETHSAILDGWKITNSITFKDTGQIRFTAKCEN